MSCKTFQCPGGYYYRKNTNKQLDAPTYLHNLPKAWPPFCSIQGKCKQKILNVKDTIENCFYIYQLSSLTNSVIHCFVTIPFTIKISEYQYIEYAPYYNRAPCTNAHLSHNFFRLHIIPRISSLYSTDHLVEVLQVLLCSSIHLLQVLINWRSLHFSVIAWSLLLNFLSLHYEKVIFL